MLLQFWLKAKTFIAKETLCYEVYDNVSELDWLLDTTKVVGWKYDILVACLIELLE
jgi:hypothetical protein